MRRDLDGVVHWRERSRPESHDYDSLGLAPSKGAGKHEEGQKQTSFHKSLSLGRSLAAC
jgi:hypothetical protein